MPRPLIATLLACAVLAAGELSPSQALAAMTVPPGVAVNLFASDPEIVQPFAFCFDERGRMWLAENLNYSSRGNHKPGDLSRIVILADTDGDGRMDKRTVFLDQVFFPGGLAWGHGGLFVGSPPRLLFFPDRDRDDKPDSAPEVLLDGWGINDRHETLNSFMWGPDGWLYGCHGLFTHSKVGKPGAPDSERQGLNAGVFRYHPLTRRFEVFAHGTSNPWGIDYDPNGQFLLTACVIPHLWHIIQGGLYQRQGGNHFNPNVYQDIGNIFKDAKRGAAYGGAIVYQADNLPERFRGRVLSCSLHHHKIYVDRLASAGSGFTGHHDGELAVANDNWWIGFNTHVGPDGALFVIDWHDSDICGNKVTAAQTGRIFRYAAPGTRYPTTLDLGKATDAELVRHLGHANNWYERTARRLLAERAVAKKLDAATPAALKAALAGTATPTRMRALWALHGIAGFTVADLTALLADRDEFIRAWAIQLLCENGTPAAAVLTRFAELAVSDPSAVVRLYLAAACQRISISERWPLIERLAAHGEDDRDHNIPLMLWYALEPAVPADQARALKLVSSAKIAKLRQFVPRRLAVGSPAAGRKSNDDDD